MAPVASGHPGITVDALIDEMSVGSLRELIGAQAVAALRSLDPSLAEAGNLRSVAKRIIDPAEALQHEEMREALIDCLPIEKARELAKRLDASVQGDIYGTLRRLAADSRKGDELWRFFGVVAEDRAPEVSEPAVQAVTPAFGLFPHQRDAASRVLKHLERTPRKVVLHMPTGAGKTRTAMHVVARHLAKHEPTIVCWLAYSAELLEQAADSFKEAWSSLGNRSVDLVRFWGNRNPDLSEMQDGFIVAGLGKMHAASSRDPSILHSLGDRASLTVVDEAHQVVAPTHRRVAEGLHTKQPQNALLGLTATPGRTWADIAEDEQLSEFFERCKVTLRVEGYDDPVSFLIDQGYLARPKFRTFEGRSEVTLSEGENQAIDTESEIPESVLRKLGADEKRNVAIVRELEDMMRRHKRILFFAASVEHARLISAILVARGHQSDVVTGETGAGARRRLIRRFRSGNPDPIVLANYGVLTTGFDAPNTSAALIARPTRSLVLYSQMVGRATRGPKAGGNETAEIVTVVDTALPGFGSVVEAFHNWEDVWDEHG